MAGIHTQTISLHVKERLQHSIKGLGALIGELKSNGKFKETLILICGEFGRTPKINYNEGRDHFAYCWNAALISGAFSKGMVFGESSRDGYKVSNGVFPGAAALFNPGINGNSSKA